MNVLDLLKTNIAYADSVTVGGQLKPGASLEAILGSALSVVLTLGGLAVFGALIYSGFLFITSQGNPEKVTIARTAITYAIIGTIIVALSYLVLVYLKSQIH